MRIPWNEYSPMKKILLLSLLLPALALGVLSCSRTDNQPAAEPEISLQQPVPVADADLQALVQGNNEFAFDLYAQLSKKDGNILFSPYSISTALAMTYAGARGETAEQMTKTLHFTLGQEKLHPACANLIWQLQAGRKEGGYDLFTANALWGQQGYPFQKDFLELTRRNYGAGLREVDFKKNPEAAREQINRWVEKQTREKIQGLLQPDNVNKYTRFVLVNAVYFKADWDRPFYKELTKDADFHITSKEKIKIPMMHQISDYWYCEGDDFQLLRLKYGNSGVSMIVLLPKKAENFSEFEKSITAPRLNDWIRKIGNRPVDLTFPKLKMTARLELSKELTTLGMARAFTKNADFTGTGGRQGDLLISNIIHQACLEVDEQGAEAAAVTAVVGIEAISDTTRPSSATMRIDHPFLFLIRDEKTGSILFLGRIVNPRS